MAGKNSYLTNNQRVRLGASITLKPMKSIALGYFNLSKTTVKNLETESKDDVEEFNREVIEKWENHSSGSTLVSWV